MRAERSSEKLIMWTVGGEGRIVGPSHVRKNEELGKKKNIKNQPEAQEEPRSSSPSKMTRLNV